ERTMRTGSRTGEHHIECRRTHLRKEITFVWPPSSTLTCSGSTATSRTSPIPSPMHNTSPLMSADDLAPLTVIPWTFRGGKETTGTVLAMRTLARLGGASGLRL